MELTGKIHNFTIRNIILLFDVILDTTATVNWRKVFVPDTKYFLFLLGKIRYQIAVRLLSVFVRLGFIFGTISFYV
jgi:hypothetical protein